MMPEDLQGELNQLEKYNSPMAIFKKALSSFKIVLLIILGVLANWILAFIFVVSGAGGNGVLGAVLPLVLFIVAFPAIYLILAFLYGKGLVVWEAYNSAIKPLIGRIFGSIFNRFVSGESTGSGRNSLQEQQQIKEEEDALLDAEMEEKTKGLMDKLPEFISSRLHLVTTIKEIVQNIKLQKRSGLAADQIKSKAMSMLFEALDRQLDGIVSPPSALPFYIALGINLAFFVYITL